MGYIEVEMAMAMAMAMAMGVTTAVPALFSVKGVTWPQKVEDGKKEKRSADFPPHLHPIIYTPVAHLVPLPASSSRSAAPRPEPLLKPITT